MADAKCINTLGAYWSEVQSAPGGYLPVAIAATLAGRHRNTLYHHLESGKVRAFSILGQSFVRVVDVAAWVADESPDSAAQASGVTVANSPGQKEKTS